MIRPAPPFRTPEHVRRRDDAPQPRESLRHQVRARHRYGPSHPLDRSNGPIVIAVVKTTARAVLSFPSWCETKALAVLSSPPWRETTARPSDRHRRGDEATARAVATRSEFTGEFGCLSPRNE